MLRCDAEERRQHEADQNDKKTMDEERVAPVYDFCRSAHDKNNNTDDEVVSPPPAVDAGSGTDIHFSGTVSYQFFHDDAEDVAFVVDSSFLFHNYFPFHLLSNKIQINARIRYVTTTIYNGCN